MKDLEAGCGSKIRNGVGRRGPDGGLRGELKVLGVCNHLRSSRRVSAGLNDRRSLLFNDSPRLPLS